MHAQGLEPRASEHHLHNHSSVRQRRRRIYDNASGGQRVFVSHAALLVAFVAHIEVAGVDVTVPSGCRLCVVDGCAAAVAQEGLHGHVGVEHVVQHHGCGVPCPSDTVKLVVVVLAAQAVPQTAKHTHTVTWNRQGERRGVWMGENSETCSLCIIRRPATHLAQLQEAPSRLEVRRGHVGIAVCSRRSNRHRRY